MKLLIVGIIVLILNVPFGYWRDNVKKFSLKWFLAVHLPIPFIVFTRIYSGLGFQLITFPVVIGSYFIGQYIGARINRFIKKRNEVKQSSSN